MTRNIIAGLSAMFTLAGVSLPLSASADEPYFPVVETADLTGAAFTLPQDLPDSPTLVLVAFQRHHQRDVNGWIEAMDLKSDEAPAWIETPVVGDMVQWRRDQLDGWMRAGIPETAMQERTLTLYVDRADFARALGLGIRQIGVAVVDQDGTVHAAVFGPHTQSKETTIRAALAQAGVDATAG